MSVKTAAGPAPERPRREGKCRRMQSVGRRGCGPSASGCSPASSPHRFPPMPRAARLPVCWRRDSRISRSPAIPLPPPGPRKPVPRVKRPSCGSRSEADARTAPLAALRSAPQVLRRGARPVRHRRGHPARHRRGRQALRPMELGDRRRWARQVLRRWVRRARHPVTEARCASGGIETRWRCFDSGRRLKAGSLCLSLARTNGSV